MEHRKPHALDYVKYDPAAAATQTWFKDHFMQVMQAIEDGLWSEHPKTLALTKLEEAYMWVGKAIRDDQLMRNAGTQLEEQRRDS